jgi:predicted SprT family Zn-dependent metalloprotease
MNILDAKRLAERLMKTHKLTPAWSFHFDSAKVRFGKCDYGKREITLSRHLVELNDEAEVRDTILHEIAHALVRPSVGHGQAWQRIAHAIGCNARRCYGDEVVRPKPRHKGTCPACHRVVYRHRRVMIACAHCSPVFDKRFAFIWSGDENAA